MGTREILNQKRKIKRHIDSSGLAAAVPKIGHVGFGVSYPMIRLSIMSGKGKELAVDGF